MLTLEKARKAELYNFGPNYHSCGLDENRFLEMMRTGKSEHLIIKNVFTMFLGSICLELHICKDAESVSADAFILTQDEEEAWHEDAYADEIMDNATIHVDWTQPDWYDQLEAQMYAILCQYCTSHGYDPARPVLLPDDRR